MTLSWTQAIVGGFALAGAVATATWTIKQDHIADLESRLQACENANKLGYPELVKALNDSANALRTRLETLQQNETLQADITGKEIELAALKQRFPNLKRSMRRSNKKASGSSRLRYRRKMTAFHG